MEPLPNLFESYSQPENKLTLALLQTLAADDRLARRFLKWAVPGLPAPRGKVYLYSQRKPAVGRGFRTGDPELDPAIPDGWFATDDLLVAVEVKKDPGVLRADQLKGHLKALMRREATQKGLLVLTPDHGEPSEVVTFKGLEGAGGIPVWWRGWAEVHRWACVEIDARGGERPGLGVFLLRRFREYMEMSEVSGFAGVVFDEGYDYRRAKAILKALRQELVPEVERLYPDLQCGRGHITDDGLVWDVFGRRDQFTKDPHFTLVVDDGGVLLALTVPDKATQAWRVLSHLASRPRTLERAVWEFLGIALRGKEEHRPVISVEVKQRHWKGRSGPSFEDAKLISRLDIARFCPSKLRAKGVKEKDSWWQNLLTLLSGGKGTANWEFQIQNYFGIDQEVTKTRHLKAELVRIFGAFKPLYELVSTQSR